MPAPLTQKGAQKDQRNQVKKKGEVLHSVGRVFSDGNEAPSKGERAGFPCGEEETTCPKPADELPKGPHPPVTQKGKGEDLLTEESLREDYRVAC